MTKRSLDGWVARGCAGFGLVLLVGGCLSTVTQGAKQAIVLGSQVAAREYLTQNPHVRGELGLGAQLMTDAVLAFHQYRQARLILEAETGVPARVVAVSEAAQ